VAAVADDRSDRRPVPPTRLERHEVGVDEAVGAPAEHRPPVGGAFPAVHRLVDGRHGPGDARRLEPAGGQQARRHDRVLHGVHPGLRHLTDVRWVVAADEVRRIAIRDRSQVRVLRVDEHARGSAPTAEAMRSTSRSAAVVLRIVTSSPQRTMRRSSRSSTSAATSSGRP
jgi:hypothetical protein